MLRTISKKLKINLTLLLFITIPKFVWYIQPNFWVFNEHLST